MKKALLLFLLVAAGAITTYGQSRIGGNIAYGTEIEELGIGINGEFFLKSNLAIAPGFNYYFVEDPVNFWELNANVNYYFSESGSVAVYVLGGLNLAHIGFDGSDFGVPDRSDNELGVNIGVGANFDVGGSVVPFAQFRYVLGDFDQAVFSFGVRFPLK